MDVVQTQDELVDAIRIHAALDGWTDRSLRAAAADLGLDPDAGRRAFPGGMVEVIRHWCDWSDRRMVARLSGLEFGESGTGRRLAAAIRARLEVNACHREAVRRAVAFLTLPQHLSVGAETTLKTVNALWYAAGDRSADFSYYTRRALLVPIYTATVLYWLADESEECVDTWDFIDRSLKNVTVLGGLRRRLNDAAAMLASPMSIFRRRAS
jgi:ubiquinone biosynthesis protein COQ9